LYLNITRYIYDFVVRLIHHAHSNWTPKYEQIVIPFKKWSPDPKVVRAADETLRVIYRG